jgi:hypothetical protein
MVPALVGIDGIIGSPSRMQRKPRIDPPSIVLGCVIIPIIIMAISGPEKQGVIKDIQTDHKAG